LLRGEYDTVFKGERTALGLVEFVQKYVFYIGFLDLTKKRAFLPLIHSLGKIKENLNAAVALLS